MKRNAMRLVIVVMGIALCCAHVTATGENYQSGDERATVECLQRTARLLRIMDAREPADLLYHCRRGVNHWRLRFRNDEDAAAFAEEHDGETVNWAALITAEQEALLAEDETIEDILGRNAADDARHALEDLTGRIEGDMGRASDRQLENAIEALNERMTEARQLVAALRAALLEAVHALEQARAQERETEADEVETGSGPGDIDLAEGFDGEQPATLDLNLLGQVVSEPVAPSADDTFLDQLLAEADVAQSSGETLVTEDDTLDVATVDDIQPLTSNSGEDKKLVNFLMQHYGCSLEQARELAQLITANEGDQGSQQVQRTRKKKRLAEMRRQRQRARRLRKDKKRALEQQALINNYILSQR